jgi:hypothetical protein
MEIGPMTQQIKWNGTTSEALALLQALRAYCQCRVERGHTLTPCESHRMIAHDQRAVDGLLFMRRMAARLLVEEFGVPGYTPIAAPVEEAAAW